MLGNEGGFGAGIFRKPYQISVYVYVRVGGACGYPCLCERVAHAYAGQGTTSFVSPRCHALHFLRQSLSLAWGSPGRLGWLVSKSQTSSCLQLPSVGATRAHHTY